MRGFLNAVKGLIIGSSMSVPGVSGGTMAILLGCFDELIHSASSFFKDIRKNAFFLLQIGLGGLFGFVIISKFIYKGLESDFWEAPLLCFFIGVVIGGIPVMYKKTKSSVARNSDYLFCLAGLIIVVLIGFIPSGVMNLASSESGFVSVIFLFCAGLVVSVAFILPGISTTLMLAALGLHKPFLEALDTFRWDFILPMAIGCGAGIIALTKILEKLLTKYPRKTYLMIIGFVIGSVHQVLPDKFPSGWPLILSIVTLPLGLTLILLLGKIGKDN